METITNLATFLKEIAAKKEYPKGLQLNLKYGQLDAEEIKALVMALQSGQCPPGLQLYLSTNQLGAEGAKALAMALQSRQCPQGLKLNLINNQLGTEGMKALAMALQSGQCPSGLQLYLSFNQLGGEGAKALAMALQSGQCPSGLKLHLSSNQLGAEGVKALAMALQSGLCPSRLQLYLGSNQLGAEGAKALAVALQSGQCPQGLKLYFANNQLRAEDEKTLEQAWAVYYAHQQDNFINCMTLYQGCTQSNSLGNALPPEMLQEICRHVLPATPILAKMTEISTKVFREQLATLKLADTFEHTKQFGKDLEAALSSKRLTEKAAKIKAAINNFLPKEVETIETNIVVQFPAVALLRKFHLITENEVRSITLSPIHHSDEPEGSIAIGEDEAIIISKIRQS